MQVRSPGFTAAHEKGGETGSHPTCNTITMFHKAISAPMASNGIAKPVIPQYNVWIKGSSCPWSELHYSGDEKKKCFPLMALECKSVIGYN